jgi:general secretion pathway protein G
MYVPRLGGEQVSDSLKRNLRLGAGSGKASRQFADDGFTLVEILAIIVILGILTSSAIVMYQNYRTKAKNNAAMAQIGNIQEAINQYRENNDSYPDDLSEIPGGQQLDPWQRPFQYLNIANGGKNWHGKCRRDRKLNPLNTDFDLYSMGADGKTATPLTAKASQDDIVRANNGFFIGLGADY